MPLHSCWKKKKLRKEIFISVREIRSFGIFQYIAVRKAESFSETEVLQMQNAMRNETDSRNKNDEEIIDILIAISVVSKRLAKKLEKLRQTEEKECSDITDWPDRSSK